MQRSPYLHASYSGLATLDVNYMACVYMCMWCVLVCLHIYRFIQAIMHAGQRLVCISDFLYMRRDNNGDLE